MQDATVEIPPEDAPSIASGKYRLAAPLGEGGMAAVYRAWDTVENQWCALKVLLPEYSRRKKVRKRFEREAQLMMQISHRHVVRVLDVGTGQAPWMVMELCEGGSLEDWCMAYGKMPPRMAVDVIMQVCKGAGAAHKFGVIHRDLKPHNVLITRRHVCKVTDFGIAQLDGGAGMTRTGSVMGTMGFMAPEQRADSKGVDQRADVYSIAATLYRLITDNSVADLFLAEHDASLLKDVPDALVSLLLRATAYQPSDRHPDVAALARDLHTVRKVLPEPPASTPGLAVLLKVVDHQVADAIPSFEEISEIIQAGEREAPRGTTPAEEDNDTSLLRSTSPTMVDGLLDDELFPPSPSAPKVTQDSVTQDSVTQQRGQPLPYFMPTAEDAERARKAQTSLDDVPDYVVDDGRGVGLERFEVGVDDETRRRADEARRKAAEEGVLEVSRENIEVSSLEEDEEDEIFGMEEVADLFTSILLGLIRSLMNPLVAVGLPLCVIGLVFGLMIGAGAVKVNAAADEVVHARQELYRTIEDEQAIIDELAELGAPRASLGVIYDAFVGAEGVGRHDAAIRYIGLIEAEVELQSRDVGPSSVFASRVKNARTRVNKMKRRVETYDQNLQLWREATTSPQGRAAVRLGLAKSPE